jgi:hypothetical protein
MEPLNQAQQMLDISRREHLNGVVLRGHPKVLGNVVSSLQAIESAPELTYERNTRQGFREYAGEVGIIGALYVNMTPHVRGIVLPKGVSRYDHRHARVVNTSREELIGDIA